jgi:alpha-tubulin suppressor-like RCC1 family protein
VGAAYISHTQKVTNFYITQPGTYRADLQICGIDYKTNEVEVTGTPSDIELYTEPETDFTANKAVLSSTSSVSYHQGGMSDNGEYYFYGQQVYKKDTGSFTYTTYGSALSSTIFNGSQSSISHDGNYIVSYYTNSTYQLHIIKNNGSTFTSHQIIASPNSSARSDSQPQFIPGPLKHFVWIEKVSGSSNITFHFYKYNSGTDTWSLGFSVTNPTDLTVGDSLYGRGGISFSKDGNYLAISASTADTSNKGVAVLKVDWVNETCVKKYENTSVGYWACFLSRDAKYFYYSTGTGTTAGKMLYSANGDWEGTPTDVTSSFTNIGNLGDHTSVFSGRYIFSEKGGSARYIFKWQDLISPTLTFDNYNKLSLTNTPTYTSSKLTYGSNVYDIGTLTSDITIEKQGEYASLTFDTSSNVAYFSNVTVGTVLDAPATRAFFHGNFVDTFSDGDVTTAASNGRFYADMSETTTAFGTVSVTSTTSTSTTYQVVVPTELTGTNVLIVGGGGGGGTGSGWPTGGGGGEVKNLTNQTISAGTYTIVVGNGGGTNASGTNSSALGTTANPGTSASNNGGTSGSGNGPGSNYGQYERGGGGGDASVGGNAGDRTGGSGGDGSNVSWLDGSVYGEQVSGQAYFGGGGYSGDYTGSQTNGKGNGLPGTGGGGTLGGIGRGGMIAIYSSVGLGIKYIDFDTYNKLSLSGITNPTSKLHVLPTGAESTTTYDIGTATNIYIESAGTYTVAMKGSSAFALDSTVVSGDITPDLSLSETSIAKQFIYDENGYTDAMFSEGSETQSIRLSSDGLAMALGDGNYSSNDGRLYYYERSSISDTFTKTHTFDAVSSELEFGASVDMNAAKTRIAISGTGVALTINTGRVYIYDRANTSASWPSSPTATITPPASTIRNFGHTVNMSDDGLTMITSGDAANSTANRGGVYVYEYASGSWSKTFQVTQGIDRFGFKVAMNKTGTRFIAGGTNTAYYVYHKESGTWSSTVQLTGATGYYCGMSPDGNTVAVGIVQYSSNLGRVAVYKYSGSSWGSVVNIDTTVGSGTYQIGNTPVFNNDGTLLVTGCSAYNSYMGCFEMWKYESGAWVFKKQFLNPTVKTGHGTDTGEFFGGYLSMDYAGTSVIVSNPGNDVAGADYGRVVLYGAGSPPSLNFDTYNKLTFTGADTDSTYKLKYESNTYDLGTISNVYIAYPGTYSAEIKGATNFALSSNITGSLGTYSTLHDNVAISHTTGGGQTLVTVNNIKGNKTYKISFNKQWTDSHASYSTRLKMYIRDSSDVNIRQLNSIGDYLNDPRDGILLYDAGGSFDESAMVVGTGFSVDGSAGTHTVEITGGTYGSTSSPFTLADPWYFLLTMSTSDVITGKFFVGDTEVISHFLTRPQSGTSGYSIGETGNKFVFEFWDTATISGVNMTVEEYNPAPKLDFDGYNKLTFTGLESGSTSNVTFDGNTYSIGTASNVYIENTGTYEAESKGTTTFALTSKAATIDTTVLEIAFHHGAFSVSDYSGAYSTVEAAATAGRVYSDTTPATYTWGTLNSVDISTTGQTGYSWTPPSDITADVLMVAGGGGGGGRDGGGGGAGGLVFNASQTLSGQKTIVVGDGGIGGIGHDGTTRPAESGVSGTDTSFTGFDTAVGGGGGAMQTVSSGGSGGGGGISSTTGGNGTSGQGNNGGSYVYPCAGGGGGAGGVGTNATTTKGGDGGVGLNYTSYFGTSYGDSGWFASGGGGGTRGMTVGSASAGGGGNGTDNSVGKAGDGDSHTGGGGGGGGWGGSNTIEIKGGDGGSGIVIIRSGPSATPPSLTHDGYKLVVSGITPTSTTLKYGSNTYEIGTATNIYVENTGDYSAEIGSAADFALTNTTVSGTIKTIEPGFASRYQGSMALTYDGKLYAWGMNDDGEAGVGTSSDITVPTLCTGITQGTVAKLLSSSDLTENSRGEVSYVKTIDGKIYATGKGDNFVIPGTTSDLTSFTDVTSYFGDQSLTANNVTMMSFTQLSGAALTETGNVWTWGTHDSTNKALGQASASSSSTPKQINFSSVTGTITKVTCGSVHSLALDTSGDVWFWGKNTINSDSWPSSVTDEPQKVVDGKNIIGLASSYGTMYAWDATGKMWNAGNNWEGQIGDGTTTTNTTGKTLTEVTYFSSNGITINKVYGGGYFVFADTSDGYYCWGSGGHGVFGNGSTGNITSGPAKWTNVSNIKKFMASTNHATAITEDGKYYAWGNGTNNARGDNDTGDITYPKYIDTLPNILAPSFDFDGYDKVFVNNPLDRVLAPSTIPLDSAFGGTWVTSGWSVDAMTHTSTDFIYKPTGGDSGNSFKCNKTTFVWADNSTGGTPSSVTTHGGYVYCADGYDNSGNYNASNFTTLRGRFLDPFYGMSSINTKYTKDTHTYDTNQAQIVTVSDPGTYDAQIKSGTVFSLKSATVPATKTSGLYTWAFHHGNFDNAYGDGDILTARENGRFYADTPSYTGDIGTITPTSVSSFVYKFYCTVLPQLNTQSVGDSFMSTTEISSTTTTLTSAMFEMADPNYVDSANDIQSVLFNGNINASGGYFVIKSYNDGGLAVDRHMFTITSPVELLQLSITTHRPGYMPGFKIILNDTHTLINETSNGGGSGSPSPYTKSHTFSSNYLAVTHGTTYTFTPASALTANVLMVAGGGGGGGVNAGGGGAGGLVYSLNESISTGSKTIVVGNGGLGGEGYNNGIDEIGIRGKDTTFLSYTASGGGGGGSQDSSATTQIDGGSGGGNNGVYDSGNGGSSTQNAYSGKGFGNTGGDGVDDYNGGGGGGAGGAGGNATGTGGTGGAGGIGKYYGNVFGIFYGENGWFAGGGGGASQTNHGTIGLGGLGGGGRGKEETGTYDIGFHGMSHTGGGGGAAGYTAANSNRVGGTGGTGIVLLQTDVATPNVNSEVKIPEPHYHVLIEKPDDIQFSHLPNGIGSGSVHASGSIVPNIPRADGSVSNVYYATSTGYFTAAQAGSLVSTVEGIFYPIEQERYDNILEIGHNSTNDVELEMASDGTAKLYRNNGGNELASGTVKCFTVGKWHHIALTLDTNRNAVGYVNGYPVVSATYASAKLPLAREQMCLYRTGVTATFRKFLMYYFKTYNSVLNQNQILKLASSVGLGPKLEYDGLNAINVVNTEPGSGTEITIYESNVNDTSNLYVVSCNESSYLLSNAGTYYAQIKGTDTFTITRPLTVTDDHFPLYAYPPRDGTQSSITTTTTADTWNTWTISGASNGNGQYQARSNRTATGTRNVYKAFSNNIGTGGAGEFQPVHSSGQHETGTIDLQLPSAKTIRKYVIWTTDSAFYTYNSTTYTDYDPTLPFNSSERSKRRIKSWTIQGSNSGTSWTTIHTVTNKPPSIYGDVHTISSPGSYQYYRLNWSENNGSTETTTVAELIYWGDA